jgi:hypothetical protein
MLTIIRIDSFSVLRAEQKFVDKKQALKRLQTALTLVSRLQILLAASGCEQTDGED